MTHKSYSADLWAELCALYQALDEKIKKRITKCVQDHAREMFRYWVKHSKLPSGHDHRKVARRDGDYGLRLDEFLLSEDDPNFAYHIFTVFFVNERLLDKIGSETVGSTDRNAAEREIDEFVSRISSQEPCAAFLGAFVKCFLDLGPNAKAPKRRMQESQMRLEACAQKLDDCAAQVRIAGEVDPESVSATVAKAVGETRVFHNLIHGYSEMLGIPVPEWDDASELDAKVDELAELIAAKEKTPDISVFLTELAALVRSLAVTHKSLREQERRQRLQNEAVEELEAAAASDTPSWIEEGPKAANEWVRWALDLDPDTLNALQSALDDQGYARTSELVGVGSPTWLPEPPSTDTKPDAPAQPLEVQPTKAETTATAGPPSADTPTPAPAPETPLQTDTKCTPTEPAPSALSPVADAAPFKPVSSSNPPPQEQAKPPAKPSPKPPPEPKPKTVVLPPAQPAQQPEPTGPAPGHQETLPVWSPNDVGAVAAKYLSASKETEKDARLDEVIWKLLAAREHGLAYQLARLSALVKGDHATLHPWIIEAIVLAPHVSYEQFDVHDRLQSIFSSIIPDELFREHSPETNRVLRCLLAAGALRPAILTPTTNACTTLQQLHFGDCKSLHALMQGVIEFSQLGITPRPELVTSSMSAAEWELRRKQFLDKVQNWRQSAQGFSTSYQPATQVWQEWLKPRGLVTHLLEHVGSESPMAVEELRKRLDGVNIDAHIELTRKKVLNKINRLVGTARRQLIRHAEEAIELGQEWIALVESKPGEQSDFAREQFAKLRLAFEQHGNSALKEVGLKTREDTEMVTPLTVAGGVLAQELQAATDFVTGQRLPDLGRASADILRDCALLRIKQLTVGVDLAITRVQPEEPALTTESEALAAAAAKSIAHIMNALRAGLPSYTEAFEQQTLKGDHRASGWILDHMARAGKQPEDLAPLQTKRSASIQSAVATLQRHLDAMLSDLGEALAKGHVSPTDYQEVHGRLQLRRKELHEGSLAAEGLFHRYTAEVEEADRLIEKGRREGVSRTRERLKGVKKGSPEDLKRIGEILDRGDVYLANDYIDRLESEGALPVESDEDGGTAFVPFFVPPSETPKSESLFRRIHQRLSVTPVKHAEIVAELRERDEMFGAPLDHLSTEQRAQNAEALENWFSMAKRKRPPETSALTSLFQWLGFPTKRIGYDPRTQGWFTLETQRTVSCPVPQYGSEAKGKYSVLYAFKPSTVEELVSETRARAADQSPVIVLYANKLNEKDRRKLAHRCRSENKTLLLVDDALVLYLAIAKTPRPRALFETALPFTYLMPYTTTASLLPPEMFFGRRREIEALESSGTTGSCFLYGGRQIGKTVLLRHVERRSHNSSKGALAKYVDLKLKGLGFQRDMDDLWVILMEELRNAGVDLFGKRRTRQILPEDFDARVTAWLDEDQSRRILLLLDESDRFLDVDGRAEKNLMPFSRCTVLKGLMEKTERRFKVVFAGLHNVQRSTRVANNPLAHFGTPICIGPLLQNGEARQAAELVRRPLACLGVLFQMPELPHSILARTNYYPNLVQIYCQNLLTHITDQKGFRDPEKTPPYNVTSSDIDEAYERQELRYELREKFRLTLDLDRRFSLIAHLLAYYNAEYPRGMTASAIRDHALEWWAKGFRESSGSDRPMPADSFRNLLEEMQGLGILRRTPDGLFGLRSPNVARLLGAPHEIESVLLSASDWEPPVEYIAETFRSLLDESNRCLRSPLTASQESEVKGGGNNTVVIAGTNAAGMQHILAGFNHSFGADYVVDLQMCNDLPEFESQLGGLTKRPSDGKTILVVPPSRPWDLSWLQTAAQRLKAFTRPDAQVACVFIASPERLWALRAEWPKAESAAFATLTLHPWSDDAVRQWLEDSHIGPQPRDTREAILKATGGWSVLLEAFAHQILQGQPIQEVLAAVEQAPDFGIGLKDVLAAFGVAFSPTRDVLQLMADFGGAFTTDDIAAMSELRPESLPVSTIHEALAWGSEIGIISQDAEGWALDPVLERLLKAKASGQR